MKIIQAGILLCLIAFSAHAQRADIKGPKSKNLKVHENPELYGGKAATQEATTKLKGPARKNAKAHQANSSENSVNVAARRQTRKGPKAKNKKEWQQ